MADDFKQKLAHAIPIEQSDISYNIIKTDSYKPKELSKKEYDRLFDQIIMSAKLEVEDKYGSTFTDVWPDKKDNKINYFLFGLIDPSNIDDNLTTQLKKAKSYPNSRVNLAMLFPSKNQEAARIVIQKLDSELGVNTIYQDSVHEINDNEYLTISQIDAADNMVCETFRVKYRVKRKIDQVTISKLEEARNEVWADVVRMQKIYTKNKLWHRSPYDGAFMFLTKFGWLTTATRTPKNNVCKEDLSLILDFDENSETITYAGDRLPSSDLPEFLVIVDRNESALAAQGDKTPVIKYLAHFHKNEMTRNSKLMNYAVPFYRYGEFKSGHKFANELLLEGKASDGINISGKGRGFIILEHGLVRLGVKLEHFEQFLDELFATSANSN